MSFRSDLAREALDRRFFELGFARTQERQLATPRGGWVKAIREALGMSAAQLGERMGRSQTAISQLERSEQRKTVQLDSLERAAEALGCVVVYALVPRRSLETMINDQALKVASAHLSPVHHSMALERQAVDERGQQSLVRRTAAKIKGTRQLWKKPAGSKD